MEPIKSIRRQLKLIEGEFSTLDKMREVCKTEGGRLTESGKNLLIWARDNEVPQTLMAKLLQLTPGAISQHYNR